MVKTFGIIMISLVTVAGCTKQEPGATNGGESTSPNSPAMAPNEPATAVDPVVTAPASIPSVEVAVQDPAASQGQMAQVPPTTPKAPTKLGDPAFPLVGLTFVKGKPVEIMPGKVYVVEFWATWCPPCKDSIPHLTALSKKYADKGVVFVGVSNENVGTVKPFVSEMGDKMDYNVAVDAVGGVANGYMLAFQQGGIPTAFVVDQKGRVVWYGHPMGDLEKVLSEVVAGTYKIPS